MGFFTTIVWVAIGTSILIIYGGLYLSRVSNGLHFWGKPIAQDKFQAIKMRYSMGFIFLVIITFAVPFNIPEKKEDPNAGKTNENTTVNITSTNEYTVKNQEQVIAFIQLLFSDLPVMRNYISDIEFIRPTLMDLGEYDYTFEDYGWKKQIYIEIKLKEKTNLPREWRADGQTLHFIIGSGDAPGVIAKKKVSQLFADMPVESGDSFVSLPNMIGIDDIGLNE